MSNTKVVNRWEAPRGFVAIENVGKLLSCDDCKACHMEGDPPDEYEVCNYSFGESKCLPNFRTDGKNVTLREANKHFFLHTGRDECPKWLLKLAEEHPDWRLYCWYDDGSADTDSCEHSTDKFYDLRGCEEVLWECVKAFQIIPT